MADDREFSNVYTIPPNYTDSGKLLGGLLETRNTVEACILLLLVGYPELMWMHLPATAKVVVMTVTLLPLGVFALMGIGGDSLLRFVTNMVLFWVRRRRLHYRRIGYHYGTTVTHRKRPSAQKPRPSAKSSRPSGVRTGLHSLKEIRNGIVETTDGRYLKILEIEPINFLLRSNEEQWGIISTFASWLKISPMRLQFKSVTRKADSDKYVAGLEADIESEDVTACRELGRGTIQFIREEGSREALSRRFFLIFQYEAVRRQSDNDYGEIYAALQTVTQNAKTYFAQCGNSIVQPKDEDAFVAEILYMYFNRRSCVEDPFQSRLNRVVVDAMAAKRRVVGIDPVPKIRTSNFVAPRGLDLSHAGYIIMDGTYYTYLYIRKNGFPQQVRGGWMSSLINAGEGVDVDLHLHREIRGKTIDRVAQRIRLNRTKLRELQDTSTDYEELAGSIQAGYYIKQGLSSRNEDLFYMSVLITISAPTYEELQWRKQQMSDLMKSMDIQVGDCLFQQEAALRSTMPFLYLDPGLERKSKRNVLTSGAASTYMFTSFELSDDNGILLGLNRHNNSLCIVDPFNTKVNKNANFTICGTSGAGKTFTMQVMALRLRMRGVQCYIIAPLKGHEFKRACHKIGGTYIKLAPGSSACINVMEIRPTLTPEMELIDELDYNDIDSMLAKKIQQLMIFFSLLIPDMNNEEEQMLDRPWSRPTPSSGLPTITILSMLTRAGERSRLCQSWEISMRYSRKIH